MDLLFVKIWQTGNNISELLFFFFSKKVPVSRQA